MLGIKVTIKNMIKKLTNFETFLPPKESIIRRGKYKVYWDWRLVIFK